MHNKKCLTLKMKVKVTEYNIHNSAIQWRISTSVKVICRILVMVFTISEILMVQICRFKNFGQGNGVQH